MTTGETRQFENGLFAGIILGLFIAAILAALGELFGEWLFLVFG